MKRDVNLNITEDRCPDPQIVFDEVIRAKAEGWIIDQISLYRNPSDGTYLVKIVGVLPEKEAQA